MSDFLLEIGQNPNARKLIKSLGLPIPMPQKLRRARGARRDRPLQELTVVFGSAASSSLAGVIATTLASAGAESYVVGDDIAAFRDPGEAYGRPPTPLDPSALPESFKAHALVFDASSLADPSGLRAVYDFYHPLIGAVGTCGRVIVLGRAPESVKNPNAAAAQAALEGFVRSLAKELGKKGATAQLLQVDKGAEDRIEGPLRFLLSRRSAFVTGQPLRVTTAVKGDYEPRWVLPLEGKVALVTGAARGIGAATARLLAAEGAHVVCLDRPADDGPLSQIARDIGGSVLAVDVTDPEAPQRIAGDLTQRHGGVDIVVHNAGVTRDKTLARMTGEWWDQAIDINLTAVTRITEALLDGALRDGGRIICLSSVAGIAGNLGQTNYAASKAGLIGYVGQLSTTLAGRGITVNAIAPGFIETRLTAAIPMVIREVGRRLSSLAQGGRPEDVGEAITFLSTPGASGITGRVVRVCGGAFIGA